MSAELNVSKDDEQTLLESIIRETITIRSTECITTEQNNLIDPNMTELTDSSISLHSDGYPDYRTDNILEKYGRITLAHENLLKIPIGLSEKYHCDAKYLDLSYNQFRNIRFLRNFKYLHTLVLDRNIDLDPETLPFLPYLEILWLNNCCILNITKWIFCIQEKCPNLKQLSLMGNPDARTLLNGYSFLEQLKYRKFITSMLTNLNYLDDTPVSDDRMRHDFYASKYSCPEGLAAFRFMDKVSQNPHSLHNIFRLNTRMNQKSSSNSSD